MNITKIKCNRCGEELGVSSFHKDKAKKNGLRGECKKCAKEYYKLWREKNRLKDNERTRNWKRTNKLKVKASIYKTTPEHIQHIIDNANNKCEICGSILNMCIDHDHNNGKIRGYLCNRCNTAMGMFNDDIGTLLRVIDYLGK